jgi:hypothetical protein
MFGGFSVEELTRNHATYRALGRAPCWAWERDVAPP